MDEIRHFVPGSVPGPDMPFLWYLDPVSPRVVRAYLETCTAPGDLVVDPFCQGPTILQQAAGIGRRAIGSSYDPLAVQLTRAALNPPTRQQLDTAITRLGDEPRVDLPFHEHLEALYAVTCPRCRRTTPADAFIWERDTETILRAEWACARCGHETAPLSLGDGDARGGRIERRGLQYWHAVDRVAPAGDPLRERAEQLLEIYTPRNLYALGSILIKIESLFDDETQQLLKLVLLACMEACSSLHRPEAQTRSRGLRPPARFVERNVWRAFVRAADAFPTTGSGAPIFLARDANALLKGRGVSGTALLSLGVQRLAASLPRGCAAMIVAAPPRPRPADWALSWLWAGWLFEHQEAAPLKPLLRQWRTDWEWYRRSMQAAFRALRGLLRQNAPLLLVFDDPEPPLVEALSLALAGAGYDPGAWIHQGSARAYRLTSRPAPALPAPPGDVETLARALRAEAAAAAQKLIAARGEPLTRDRLRLPIYRHLTASGLLGQIATAEELPASPRALLTEQVQKGLEESASLVALPGARDDGAPLRWWLRDPALASPPLSTRVEAAVHQLLLSSLILTASDLVAEIYRRFPKALTPDADLIEICLRSYGQEITPGHWQLRPEDQPDRRAREVSDIRGQLEQLGRRLGFTASARTDSAAETAPGHLPAFDLLWRDGDRPAYAFAIQWTARVHDLLLAQSPAGVQLCLLIPGGRAELVSFKLQRDPRLRRAVDETGWQFIKYRHLRRILGEESLDRHALKQIVGLDPIIEQDGAQMPLF